MLDNATSGLEPTGGSEPGGVVSAETLANLRDALRRRVTDRLRDGDLRAALHRLSAEARANGLHAEQVVILLKQMWGDLPEASASLAPDERRRMLERLVTLCIEEFYAGG